VTYFALNASVLLTLFVVLNLFLRKTPWKLVGLTLLATMVLTAIFDNVIVGTEIVAYDATKILGVMIGLAPVEDFAYTIAAALLIPAVWILLGNRKNR
jgi:lycopene cyclase domain-containing protein